MQCRCLSVCGRGLRGNSPATRSFETLCIYCPQPAHLCDRLPDEVDLTKALGWNLPMSKLPHNQVNIVFGAGRTSRCAWPLQKLLGQEYHRCGHHAGQAQLCNSHAATDSFVPFGSWSNVLFGIPSVEPQAIFAPSSFGTR